MKKDVLVLMAAIIISKSAAFAKDIVLSYFYGASEITDAYFVSLTIPIVIFGIIGTSIAAGYTPIYNEIVNEHGPASGIKFTNNIINLILAVCSVFVILVLTSTKAAVLLFASGFDSSTMDIAMTFTRISIVGIYFIGTFYLFEVYLQINNNYSISGFMAFPVNLLIILAIVVSTKTDKLVLSIGSVFAVIIHTLALILYSYRKGYRYQFTLDFKDIYLRRMILLVVPIILGSSTHQINQIIDRTIASQIAIGGITTLSYAQKLDSFFKDIFILSVVTVLYPNISRMAAGNHMDHFKKAVADAVSSISLLVIPATIGILIFSKPIVVLLFNRGAFNAQAVTMTANALFFYSLGITAVGIRSTFIKSMYSLKDTRTPVINSMIAMAVNIMLNILFSRYLGIGGIALANSISAILAMILMFISLRKKIGPFGMRKVAVTSLKILSVSLGMGLTAKLSFEMLKSVLSQNLSLILSVVIGIILYLVAISYAKIEMVNTMRAMILVKMKNLFGRTVSEEIPSFQSDLSRKIHTTNFSKYETGLPPSDWSVRWSINAEYAVQESSDVVGRKYLRADTCSCVSSKYETGLPPSDWSVRWSMDAKFTVLESKDIVGRKYLRADTCSCVFSKYETGLPPFDWSVRWSMDAEFAVLESEDIVGRKYLRADTCSCVFDNKLISWNILDSSFDIHVCAKIRTRETGGYRAWLAARCSGTSFDPSGYLLVMGADEVQIISYLNGNYQFHKGYPITWNANTWYWLDFRAEGNLLQGKVWKDGATEPGDYQISITDSRVTSGGWAGFGGLSPGYFDCGIFMAELL